MRGAARLHFITGPHRIRTNASYLPAKVVVRVRPSLIGHAMTQPLSYELERKASNARALLERAVADFGDVVYANSLGLEAMVLTDLIWTHVPAIEIFSIDTGRLHEETYSLLDRVQRRYGKRIRLYYPQADHVEGFVSKHGINGFYAGVEERLSCCHI